MTTVVDTSVLIDHLRGHAGARAAFDGALDAGELVAASVLTKVEILGGMRDSEEGAVRLLLDQIEWVPVDDEMTERAGRASRRYLRSHPGIDPVDYVIAATAERLSADLWTRNVRHFPMFDGLRSPY